MYNHPLKTRKTIDEILSNFLLLRINIREYLLVEDLVVRQGVLNEIVVNQANILNEIDKLGECYLGPREDIDELNREFILWNSILQETLHMATSGKPEEARQRQITGGIGSDQAKYVMAASQKISDFASKKANELFANSVNMSRELRMQLFLLVVLILILSKIINSILFYNISNPIRELTESTKRFRKGDLNSRSPYVSSNELGILSGSFNSLTESIQENMSLNEKVVSLARLMLSKYEVKEFFRETLNALSLHTNSQMAAIYLLSDDKQTFEHIDSIGLDDNARLAFDALNFEGEFGVLLASHKVQHIKDLPDDTRFVFHTVSRKFIPREIITIQVLSQQEVVAIISLASISSYNHQSIQLIESILDTLNARIEGIIAYHKMLKFSKMLEHKNQELESLETELAAQSVELLGQNIDLEIQKRQLEEASLLKTNFLSNMSHELRTPLNSVIALSEVLSHRLVKKIPEEEYGYLEVIARNGKHLLSVINDILDISRIEAGHEEIELSGFNANDLIADVISMIQPQAGQRNIELLFNPGSSALSVTSDANKCRHILINFVGNAVKFTEKGKVSISAEQSDLNFDITVTDTGIGISEKNLPYIFNEFRQVDLGASRKFGGTGLGLTIAKKYANLLGGTISVKSTPGKGSEFKLSLPVRYAAENRISEAIILTRFKPENRPIQHQLIQKGNVNSSELVSAVDSMAFPEITAAKDAKEELRPSHVKPLVLDAEDNRDNMTTVKAILAGNYSVLEASDSIEAVEMAGKHKPDLILMDIDLPNMDGIAAFKIIRQDSALKYIPVIALTASAMVADREIILAEGMDTHIPKPIDEKTFCKTINCVLYGK